MMPTLVGPPRSQRWRRVSAHDARLHMSHGTPVVFVIDDDVSVRESVKLLIESVGWRSEAFASGQEFLARSRELGPSCLVLDVGLPDLNGLDVQTLVADRTDLPVIFITGQGDVRMTVRA